VLPRHKICQMSNLPQEQSFPVGKDGERPQKPAIEYFIALLPELYYGINRVLEDCTPRFSKKVGVALWALDASKEEDRLGRYLTTSQLVSTFRNWFVVSEGSANSEVSKVKRDLFDLDLIEIRGGIDHIHLNEKGEAAVRELMAKAREVLEITINVLENHEQLFLLNIAQRLIATKKKPPVRDSLQLDFPET
jgi:hypothetical protein